MKQSSRKLFRAPLQSCAGLAAAGVLSLLGATALQAQTQIINDNFDGQSDSLWTRYNLGPITQFYTGFAYGAAHFSFPANPAGPSGNYGYKILADPTWLAPANGDPIPIGNARAASFRSQEQYGATRFQIGVDLAVWNDPALTWNQSVGLIFNAQPATIGPGTTDGYAATIEPVAQALYLSIVTGEQTSTMARQRGIPLDPTQQYRMVVSCSDPLYFVCTLYHLPDTNNPWVSAITTDISYAYAPGFGGLLVFEGNYPSPVAGATTTFDNYHSDSPAAGAMPATVTDLNPQPAGKATELYPTVTVGILGESRDTAVNTGTIQLYQDGALIAGGDPNLHIDTSFVHKPDNEGSYPKTFTGATVYYTNTTLFPPGSKHTNEIVFQDDASAWHTNIWAWTTAYPYVYASNSLPIGSLSVPGFDARTVHSSVANIDGSLYKDPTNSIPNIVASAQAVLAGQFAVDLTSTNYVKVVAYSLSGTGSGAITNFPGLCLNPPSPWQYSFAVQVLTYLELSAGTNLFYLSHDDRVGIYSGASLKDTSNVVLENIGSPGESPYFSVVAEAAGLYPFNIVYEQGGGGAALVLNSVDSSGNNHLVGDVANGGIPAFYPLVVKSSTSVQGPYTADATANANNTLATAPVSCDGTNTLSALNLSLTGGTVTLPSAPTAPKFYHLDGPRTTKITGITKSGVITYTGE